MAIEAKGVFPPPNTQDSPWTTAGYWSGCDQRKGRTLDTAHTPDWSMLLHQQDGSFRVREIWHPSQFWNSQLRTLQNPPVASSFKWDPLDPAEN